MIEDTKTTNAEVAAQNQTAAGATDPNASGDATVNAGVGNASTTAPAQSASDAKNASSVADPNAPTPAAASDATTATTTPSNSASSTGETSSPSASPSTPNSVGEREPSTSTPAGALAGANTLSGVDSTASSSKADSTFINDPNTQQASLAGTSGKTGNLTGMAAEGRIEKIPAASATKAGVNAGVDAPNVNVRVANAVHPVVHEVQKRTHELKLIVGNQPSTPWIQRALKDLQTFEEWVIQHFEEQKRKG